MATMQMISATMNVETSMYLSLDFKSAIIHPCPTIRRARDKSLFLP
jgi:hypothetical protein